MRENSTLTKKGIVRQYLNQVRGVEGRASPPLSNTLELLLAYCAVSSGMFCSRKSNQSDATVNEIYTD